MSQRISKRWRSKFARFVGNYGTRRLASHLSIDQSAIYHWIRGKSAPHPLHAAIIQRLARERGIRLTFDEIYRTFLEQQAITMQETSRVAASAKAVPLAAGNVCLPAS
jgi:hypothetical protein